MEEKLDPIAPVRPMSLSQRSGVDKALKDSFEFEENQIGTAGDFVSDGSVNEDFVKTVMNSLKGATNESGLQHGFLKAVSRLRNITVPQESVKPPKEKDMSLFNKLERIINPVLYQEKDMKTVLDLYAKLYFSKMGLIDEKAVEAMEAAEPGLFVRASSRPDISVVVKVGDDDGDLATGEIKNDGSFTVREALMLEGAYLMLVLYWWRLFAPREVAEVYGFVLCGPHCRDLKQRKRDWLGRPASDAKYCICLLKLSAPTYLGGIPCLTYYKGISSINDDSTVRTLCQFLTEEKMWGKKTTHIIENSSPAWFTAPQNLSKKLSSQKQWELQYNGTPALVFRCSGKKGVQEVMDLTDDELCEISRLTWTPYLDEQEKIQKEPIFYVKVSTAATDRNFSSVVEHLRSDATLLKDEDFLRTYPVPSVDSANCCCLLMADRGSRIKSSMSWTLDQFNQMFGELREKTIALSKRAALQHGDIAKHNIVIEKDLSRFVLIDWDEARRPPKSRESRGDVYLELLHPESLRGKPRLYTEVQLALLYWRLSSEHVENTDWMAYLDAVPGFEEYRNAVRTDEYMLIEQAANAFVSGAVSEAKGRTINYQGH